jgi:hypothetical protein
LADTPLIGRSVLTVIFIVVVACSTFGLIAACFDALTARRRLADVPKPPGSPERIIANGVRRTGVGGIVMMTASLVFGVLTLVATLEGSFSMTANGGGVAFMMAVCAPGFVTTVTVWLEIRERVRIDRIYDRIDTPRRVTRLPAHR